MVELLLVWVADELEIVQSKPLTRAVVELDEQEKVVESNSHPKIRVFLSMERKDEAFVASPFESFDSGHIDINVSPESASKSVTLPQPKQAIGVTGRRWDCTAAHRAGEGRRCVREK